MTDGCGSDANKIGKKSVIMIQHSPYLTAFKSCNKYVYLEVTTFCNRYSITITEYGEAKCNLSTKTKHRVTINN